MSAYLSATYNHGSHFDEPFTGRAESRGLREIERGAQLANSQRKVGASGAQQQRPNQKTDDGDDHDCRHAQLKDGTRIATGAHIGAVETTDAEDPKRQHDWTTENTKDKPA